MGTLYATKKGFASLDRNFPCASKKHIKEYFCPGWECKLFKEEKADSLLKCMSTCCFALDTFCSIPSNTLAIWLKSKDFKVSFCYLECYSWASLINQGQTLWSDSLYKKNPNKKLLSSSTRNTPVRALKHTGSFDSLDFWSQLQVISKITHAQVGFS